MRIPEQTARLLRALTDSRALCGAALGVVGGAGERATLVLGHAQLVPETRVLTPAHWFDLASLTKPLLTAREVLRATGRGQLDLDDPLSVHLPETGGRALGGRTLRQLLSHSSGVPAGGFLPLHEWGDPATIRARLPLEPWALAEVGAVEYSDLGYLLLGLVLERVTGRPLGDFELDAGLSFFPDPAQTVATEDCPWRGRVMRGEVHDEKAFALGGPAGHAGLFGTLDGVLTQAEGLLRGFDTEAGAAHLDETIRVLGAARADLEYRPRTELLESVGNRMASLQHTIVEADRAVATRYFDVANTTTWQAGER